MSDYDGMYQRGLYLDANQQDLLLAALASSNHFSNKTQDAGQSASPHNPANGSFEPVDSPPDDAAVGLQQHGEDSPFLDFDLDPDFDLLGTESLIGDLPEMDSVADDTGREKRKSLDGAIDEEGGKKRKENGEKTAKKPGRKPLTSEPTSKRKAQNRAAQRAFRERKEKHLKDLETKVETLEKASQAANNENSLLRAQIDRLQVELKEYRKRLSWASGGNSMSFNPANRGRLGNEFTFEFPKFGDLTNSRLFGNNKNSNAKGQTARQQTSPSTSLASQQNRVPGLLSREALTNTQIGMLPGGYPPQMAAMNGRLSNPAKQSISSDGSYVSTNGTRRHYGVSPTVAARDGSQFSLAQAALGTGHNYMGPDRANSLSYPSQSAGTSIVFSSDSPSTSSDSHHGHQSSIGTSPEPMANSPQIGHHNGPQKSGEESAHPPHNEFERAFYSKLEEACGCAENPVPPALTRRSEQPQSPLSANVNAQQTSNTLVDSGNQNQNPGSDQKNNNDVINFQSFDWLAQQNGGQFDPVLFGDYREPQDAVLSQDFGSFFDDAFPFAPPELSLSTTNAPKPDRPTSTVLPLADDEEVVPGEDRSKMMDCTKIWDRLQTIEKFKTGELDIDNLCSELRTKARCSETGVVVDQKDVEEIMTRAH